MRAGLLASISLILTLAGCASVAPREYLDPDTAATITVVAKPWILLADNSPSDFNKREFLDLYAVNINRTGDHRQYFAVMQSQFYFAPSNNETAAPVLEIETPTGMIALRSTTQSPRQLGITKPLEEPYTVKSRWWYFPVSKENLGAIARSTNLHATLVSGDARVSYGEFRNGSAELAKLSASLQ